MTAVSDHLAQEADRLRNDPIFNKALDDIRADALNELATANADDKTNIIRLQQVATLVNEIRSVLDRYVMAADTQDESGSFV